MDTISSVGLKSGMTLLPCRFIFKNAYIVRNRVHSVKCGDTGVYGPAPSRTAAWRHSRSDRQISFAGTRPRQISMNTEAFGWAGSMQGGLLRAFTAPSRPLIVWLGDTVRLWWRVTAYSSLFTLHSLLGLPTLDRFPRFSAVVLKRSSVCSGVMPKTAEIDQTWPFFLLPTSAVALLHYLQPSTKCA